MAVGMGDRMNDKLRLGLIFSLLAAAGFGAWKLFTQEAPKSALLNAPRSSNNTDGGLSGWLSALSSSDTASEAMTAAAPAAGANAKNKAAQKAAQAKVPRTPKEKPTDRPAKVARVPVMKTEKPARAKAVKPEKKKVGGR